MAQEETSPIRSEPTLKTGATVRRAQAVIQRCLDQARTGAVAIAQSNEGTMASEAELRNVIDTSLLAMQLFRAWLSAAPYASVHEVLKVASQFGTRTQELEAFSAELSTSVSDPIPHLDRIRNQITFRLRRQRAKLAYSRKRLAFPSFQDNSSCLIATLHWRGEGTEPSLEDTAVQALSAKGGEFFGTADDDNPSLTTLHMLLQQTRELRLAMHAFEDLLSTEPYEQMDAELCRLQSELEATVRCSLVVMLSTRWLGETQASLEADALRLFIPQVEERGQQFYQRFRDLAAHGVLDRLRDIYSQLHHRLAPTN